MATIFLLTGTVAGANSSAVSNPPVDTVVLDQLDIPGEGAFRPSTEVIQKIEFRSNYPLEGASFQLEIYDASPENLESYRTFKLEKSHSTLYADVSFKTPKNWTDYEGETSLYYHSRNWTRIPTTSNGTYHRATMEKTGLYALGYMPGPEEPVNQSARNSTSKTDEPVDGENPGGFPYLALVLVLLGAGAVVGGVLYYRRIERVKELAELSSVIREGVQKGAIPEDARTRKIINRAQNAIRNGNLESANSYLSSLKDRIRRKP